MGKIDHCAACGVVTLHIGAISLRFDPESAEAVWALLSEGLAALRKEAPRNASCLPPRWSPEKN
jgi:hypothetical protein